MRFLLALLVVLATGPALAQSGRLSPQGGTVVKVAASPGSGIVVTGTTAKPLIGVDTTAIQSRVTGTCSAGSSIRVIASDGSVTCEVDDIGTAGAGLTLLSGVFAIDPAYTQRRVSGACSAGSSIRAVAQDGTVTCETDDTGGTITGAANVLLKSDGAGNAVASSWTDNGTTSTTTTNLVIGDNAPTAINASSTLFPSVTPKVEILTGTGTGAYSEAVVIRHKITSDSAVNRRLGLLLKLSSEAVAGESAKYVGLLAESNNVFSNQPSLYLVTNDTKQCSLSTTGVLNCVGGLQVNGTNVATTSNITGTVGRSARITAANTVGTGAFVDDGTNATAQGTFATLGNFTAGDSTSADGHTFNGTVTHVSTNSTSTAFSSLWTPSGTTTSGLADIQAQARGTANTGTGSVSVQALLGLADTTESAGTGSLTVSAVRGRTFTTNADIARGVMGEAVGANTGTNQAAWFDAQNGAFNAALVTANGEVQLNSSSGNTCIGTTGCSSKLTVNGTASISSTATITGLLTATGGVTTPSNLTTTGTGDLVSGDDLTVADAATINGAVTLGDATTDAHTLNGTLAANSTSGANGQVFQIISGLPKWGALTMPNVSHVEQSISGGGGNNIALNSDTTLLHWNNSGSNATITGFTGGGPGRWFVLDINDGGVYTLAHNSSSSSVGNRIFVDADGSYVVRGPTALLCAYDNANTRWSCSGGVPRTLPLLTVSGSFSTQGNVTLGNDSGDAVSMSGTLNVIGAADFDSTVNVDGAVTANADVDIGDANTDTLTITAKIDSNVYYTGEAPSLSNCGTGSTITGNNERFTITIGTGTPSSCTVTFAGGGFTTNAPVCSVTPGKSVGGPAPALSFDTAYSATAVTINAASGMSSGVKIFGRCDGWL